MANQHFMRSCQSQKLSRDYLYIKLQYKNVMTRNKAIKIQMHLRFPDLYQWHYAHNDVAGKFAANQNNDAL